MPKTKISEFSATPANNTDIDSINIAEGCSPSGINDAIRELMAQLKDFQTGAVGDSFNGPVGTTTAAAGAFTTLSASGAVTLSGGTANGVAYLNGSKVVTSGSALTFDGTTVGVNTGVSNSTSMLLTGSYGAGGTATMLAFQRAGGAVAGALRYSDVTGSIEFGTTTNHSLLFLQNNSEAMRLTSTGLGIGTSNPSAKLGVAGNVFISGTTPYIAFDTTQSGSTPAFIQYASSALVFGTGSSERMRLDSSGNLGLGVTPSAWSSQAKAIQIGAYAGFYQNASGLTAASFNSFQNTSNIDTYRVSSNGAGKYEIGGGHAWYVAPSGTAGNAITFTQAMTLDATGDLALGRTSVTPFASGYRTLDMDGTNGSGVRFRANGTTEAYLYCTTTSSILGTGGADPLVFETNGTERARIDSSGRFSTGTTSVNGGQLTVGGNMGPSTDNASTCANAFYRWSVVYAGTGSINTSDAREKTAVRSLNASEITAAQQLANELGAYKWLSAVAEKGNSAREHIGMTVQRAIEIMEANGLTPFNYGFICYDENEETSRYSFRMDELAMFIARGQQAEINSLKARLDAANL